MGKVFISHSSTDKIAVRRLKDDLQNAGIRVWLDEAEIRVGDSIAGRIQQGLQEADLVCLWLTKAAISSGWVRQEWLSKFHQGVSNGATLILPLLAEDGFEMPFFLRDTKYADFRADYRFGLQQLLEALKVTPQTHERTISSYVDDLLQDLKDAVIPLPLHGKLAIIDTLRRLPRSGKRIRLEKYRPSIPVRSIFDHILSVAHSADALFSRVEHGIPPGEKTELARCIVYHDLAEVLLGDVPAYTNVDQSKRSRAQVFAERRLRDLPEGTPKRVAMEFISMFLDGRERESLRTAERILAEKDSRVRRFFLVLDKIDPIIAVWRYLHEFRGTLDPDAQLFLKRMKDFFVNPKVKQIARDYIEDRNLEQLVLLLQDPQRARWYYRDVTAIPESPFGDREALAYLIQGTTLMSVPEARGGPRRERRKRPLSVDSAATRGANRRATTTG